MLLRIGFGVSLALVGLAHYMDITMFVQMTAADLGPLAQVGKLWAYALPALMIVGGMLIVTKYRLDVGAWCAGIALVSIVIGMPLKAVIGGANLGEVMSGANNAFIWLLVYALVVKCAACGSGSCKKEDAPPPAEKSGCGCGCG